MTTQRDVERLLDRYLADGAEQVPDRVIDAALREIENTSQRRALRVPWRFDDMTTQLRLALVGAAVVAVLVASGVFLTREPTASVGGPPAATPSPAATSTRLPSGEAAAVGPGRYFADVDGYRFTFTVVGGGWRVAIPGSIAKESQADRPDFAGLGFWGTPATVVTDSCQWGGKSLTPGPTVDDFVDALAAQRGWETSEPTDVTVDGYSGKRLQLQIPDDVDFADCPQSQYRSFEGRYYQFPGQVDDVRILDLDGTRHLFFATYSPGTPAETRGELDQMAASIEIEPVER